jgi:hypothetical protein
MKKKSGLQTTIILAIIVLAMGGALWWLLSTQENAMDKRLVLQIPESQVQSIEVTKTDAYGNPQHYVVRREGANSWKLAKPFADIVNVTTVTNMVKVFEKFEAESTIKDVKDLQEFGLDKPELTVKIGYQKKRSLTLLVGTPTAFPGSFYAKFSDKPDVFVINSSLRTYLNNDMNSVRERKVMEIDAKSIRRIEFTNRKKLECLLANDNDTWTLEAPFKERMTAGQANQIINSLNVLNADDIIDNVTDPKAYGLDNPEYRLKLILTNGNTIVIKANNVDNSYYVSCSTRPMSVFKIGFTATLDWQYDPEAQLDKRLVIYSRSQVQSVKYQASGGPEQELKGDGLISIWVSFSQLNVTGFNYAKPAQPASAESFKPLQPIYRYNCSFTTSNMQNLVISVYPAPGTAYYVTSSERPFVYKINKSDIDGLNQKIAEALKLKK